MHLLFAQFTVRWLALVTGAAHTTSALRSMARQAPALEDEEPPSPRLRVKRVLATAAKARPRLA